MKCRSLGFVALWVAGACAPPLRAETCLDVITEVAGPGGEEGALLWISERAFSGPLDPACNQFERSIEWIRCRLRPPDRCRPADPIYQGPGAPPDTPETHRLRSDLFRYSKEILVGVVVATEPGLGFFGGHAESRVRGRVTEVIRSMPGSHSIDSRVAFLVDGGRSTIDGHVYCADLPAGARQWRAGDEFLVAGEPGLTTDPDLIVPDAMVLRVVGGRALPSESWPLDAGSLELEEIRGRFGNQPSE